MTFYLLVSALGYLALGDAVPDNVLLVRPAPPPPATPPPRPAARACHRCCTAR